MKGRLTEFIILFEVQKESVISIRKLTLILKYT